jgi:hypothetical protein
MHFSISLEFKIHSQFDMQQQSLLISRRLTSSIQLQHATNNVSVCLLGATGAWDSKGNFVVWWVNSDLRQNGSAASAALPAFICKILIAERCETSGKKNTLAYMECICGHCELGSFFTIYSHLWFIRTDVLLLGSNIHYFFNFYAQNFGCQSPLRFTNSFLERHKFKN